MFFLYQSERSCCSSCIDILSKYDLQSTSYFYRIEDFLKNQRSETFFSLIYHVSPPENRSFSVSGYSFSNELSTRDPTVIIPQTSRSSRRRAYSEAISFSSPATNPDSDTAANSGVGAYRVLHSQPGELPAAEVTNYVAILEVLSRAAPFHTVDNEIAGHNSLGVGELLPFVDAKLGKSYYIARFAPNLDALVILNERRARDPTVIEFLMELKDRVWGKAVLSSIQ
jgi:hypothetical protein